VRNLHKFISILFVLALTALTLAQEPVDWAAVQKIRAEGFQRSQVMETLSYLTDVYGPRLTNSPNYKKAAEWAVSKLSQWGLSNAHLEPWGVFGRGWTLEKMSAEMLEPQYTPLIAYPRAWTPGTDGEVSGEPVLLEIKSEDDFEQYQGKLKDKIVLASREADIEPQFKALAERYSDEKLAEMATAPEPGKRPSWMSRFAEYRARRALRRKIQKFLKEEGVAVVVQPSSRPYGVLHVTSAGRRPYQKEGTLAPPTVVIASEQYNRIVRLLEKEIPVKLAFNIKTRFNDDDSLGYNVIAEIPGRDKRLKKEVVMLGGHFDSWHSGTGATDNAAGSAVMMEAVRILEAIGARPRRTIRIGLWGGEEEGLLGSRGYVKKHFGSADSGEHTAEWKNFAGYFNLDNGTGKIRGVYLQGNDAVRPIFEAWLKPFHDLGAKTLTIRNTGGTDHLAFDAVGLPGFQFIQDPIDYFPRTHHTNMDVYDHALKSDLMQAAVIVASFVYHTAMRDAKLPRKAALPKERTGSMATH